MKHLIQQFLLCYLFLNYRNIDFLSRLRRRECVRVDSRKCKYIDCGERWRQSKSLAENAEILLTEVIMTGKDKDTRGAATIKAEEFLWSTEVPYLSPSFPMFFINRDPPCVSQDHLPVHLILKSLSAFSGVYHDDLCSQAAMFTVKHVMLSLTLISFHRLKADFLSWQKPLAS